MKERELKLVRWRQVRWGAAPFLLGGVIMVAWMLNREVDVWFIRIGLYLAEYEIFHILMHLFIFGCVAVLMRSETMDRRRWMMMGATVIAGAMGIEIAQVLADGFAVNAKIILAAVFDLIVDGIGVMAGLVVWERVYRTSRLA